MRILSRKKSKLTLMFVVLLNAVVVMAVADTQKKTIVTLHTTMGNIILELDNQRAPITVANFLQYVESGFYENTIFHRVIPKFMIQGGGFTSTLKQKKQLEPIINESKNRWRNERGTIAMARTSAPDSATAQFFINVRKNNNLDYKFGQPGYAVFGKVIVGMDVVDAISFEKTQSQGRYQNVPAKPILIEQVTIENQKLSQ
tara:strand:+ start:387 stop:989 length:603 start_codon:yes stop_codon:yes gene_type:complete